MSRIEPISRDEPLGLGDALRAACRRSRSRPAPSRARSRPRPGSARRCGSRRRRGWRVKRSPWIGSSTTPTAVSPVDLDRDRDPEAGMAVEVVGGAVDRVDHPPHARRAGRRWRPPREDPVVRAARCGCPRRSAARRPRRPRRPCRSPTTSSARPSAAGARRSSESSAARPRAPRRAPAGARARSPIALRLEPGSAPGVLAIGVVLAADRNRALDSPDLIPPVTGSRGRRDQGREPVSDLGRTPHESTSPIVACGRSYVAMVAAWPPT